MGCTERPQLRPSLHPNSRSSSVEEKKYISGVSRITGIIGSAGPSPSRTFCRLGPLAVPFSVRFSLTAVTLVPRRRRSSPRYPMKSKYRPACWPANSCFTPFGAGFPLEGNAGLTSAPPVWFLPLVQAETIIVRGNDEWIDPGGSGCDRQPRAAGRRRGPLHEGAGSRFQDLDDLGFWQGRALQDRAIRKFGLKFIRKTYV